MTVYIVDIESVDTRYTKQWKTWLPKQIEKALNIPVVVISGGDTVQDTTPGAFLNFGGTNVYKSKQQEHIAELFCADKILDGDYFLYTDAWNPTVIQLKYMAELLCKKIRIGGMWHAGSYDPQDFLGRLIGNKPWARHAEMSIYECFDDNFFATEFHIDLFTNTFWTDSQEIDKQKLHKIKRVGWPMEYLKDTMWGNRSIKKENIIVFPHRLAPEKQHDIFLDLKESLPQYTFITCQDKKLTKKEYHELLGRSKIVFSANLQETLGISWYEGLIVNCIPMVPDRLSYKEMAQDDFKYPSAWTASFQAYKEHKISLMERILHFIENYNTYLPQIKEQTEFIENKFFSGTRLYNAIR
jgi:glycosyltransferase involved in cell wall biosynthesis